MLKSSFDTASVIQPACLTHMYIVSPADYLSNKFWNLIFGSFNLIGMQIKKQHLCLIQLSLLILVTFIIILTDFFSYTQHLPILPKPQEVDKPVQTSSQSPSCFLLSVPCTLILYIWGLSSPELCLLPNTSASRALDLKLNRHRANLS